MSEFIKVGILRPDGAFVTTITRFEFLQPKLMTVGFLQGDPAYTDLLAPGAEPPANNNVPSVGGYVLVDCIEGKIYDWQSDGDLNFVSQHNLGFGKEAKRIHDLRRQFIRPFIVGARYMDLSIVDFVVHKFKPCDTDRQLRKLMDKFAYEGLGRTLFHKPLLANNVYYEVDMPAWELIKLSRHELSGFERLRAEVTSRCELSDSDETVWDEILEEAQEILENQKEWAELEKLLYPDGIPGMQG